jgi:TetR/AcrR family transcriptional regulator, transcriptional repressor for nem operon
MRRRRSRIFERTGLTARKLVRRQAGDVRYGARSDYTGTSIGARLRRCETLPPHAAIRSFFDNILRCSLGDRERKGCMIVNSALEIAPLDREFREAIVETLKRLESFFLD